MPKIVIDKNKCKACLLCVKFCPKKLLILGDNLNDRGSFYVQIKDVSDCSGCAFCAIMCPDCCIEIWK